MVGAVSGLKRELIWLADGLLKSEDDWGACGFPSFSFFSLASTTS
jgi:hypothetical protein